MKRITSLILIFLFGWQAALACCGAGQNRLFPLGEHKGNLVVAKFKLQRSCYSFMPDGEKYTDGYFWEGKTSLGYWVADSFQLIQALDTFKIRTSTFYESGTRADSHYVARLLPYYERMLDAALELKGFVKAKPVQYQHCSFDEQMNFITQADSEIVFAPTHEVVRKEELFTARGPAAKIYANRAFRIGRRTVWVYTLGLTGMHCGLKEGDYVANLKGFKHLESAFLKETVHWHGYSGDFIYIEP